MAQGARRQDDSPEVLALRKKIRGEALTEEERAILASATRKPTGTGAVPHEAVEAMLEERRPTRG
jgi:hypothetical protein